MRRPPPFAAFLRRVARSRLREIIALESRVRLGDAEALHDLRVAARRLRSALRLARGLFRKKSPLTKLEGAVGMLAGPLGRVRDLDVLLLDLETFAETAPREDLPHLERLVLSLQGRRAAYREDMETALRRFVRPRRQAAFEAALSQLRARDQGMAHKRSIRRVSAPARLGPDTPTRDAARQILPPLFAELIELAPAVQDPQAMPEHHRMRIRAKRLRYAMEAFAFLFPPDFGEIIAALKRVQDLLGRIHDDDVAIPAIENHLAERRRQAETSVRQAVDSPRDRPVTLAEIREALTHPSRDGEREAILRLILRTHARRRALFAEFQALWAELAEQDFAARFMRAIEHSATPLPSESPHPSFALHPSATQSQASSRGEEDAGNGPATTRPAASQEFSN